MQRLVIVGASGFGKEAAWVVQRMNKAAHVFDLLGFCDDAAEKREGVFDGFPLLGAVEDAAPELGRVAFFCAIGKNRIRKDVTQRALAVGWTPAVLVDPSAILAPTAKVGEGSFVGVGSVVSVDTHVGCGALINHHVTVGHDVKVGDFAQLCPGVRVSGSCDIGEGALMGSNACAIPGVRVGAWATVGAGVVVLSDLEDGGARVRIR